MNKTTKQSALNAHSWAGVFLSFLLFMVCVSGTLAVFHQEFERWEQPGIPEMTDIDAKTVDNAMAAFRARHPQSTDHEFVVFPTSGIPRLVVENDDIAYFADKDGQLLETERSPFTKMLIDLHLYLNLPHSWGMILVSALGAIICTLVVTGIVAHKRIKKDAFVLRRKGNRQQYKIDLHNRFGLWASPFHLIIGVTGAYFGMAGLIVVLVSQLYFDGDRDAAVAKIFTPDPELAQEVVTPEIGKTIAQMDSLAPEHELIFLTVHERGSPQQFIEIYAKAPGKMIYSENYRFDSQGEFLGTAGYQDGHWGKQLVYSLYRLHFGDFAGVPSKLLYFVLGIMLTVLCISGMEIWLAKKANPPTLTRLWYAMVWGSVSSLALTATVSLVSEFSLIAVFWALMVLNVVVSVAFKRSGKILWLTIAGFAVLTLLLVYVLVHGANALSLAALQLNIPLFIFAMWALYRAYTLSQIVVSHDFQTQTG
ncbi:PepSY-associated TM helix domain-containing protein [Alteromonas antoniana]|uniref:PepSY-associated TM helix domain-containing protein n=1 Tax=Alteromonas antoniana TaxID=2803813 RepID=UPI001C45086F|nr:PepSY-associated TM helix domain-containing protein [Alteromonas antoniana]